MSAHQPTSRAPGRVSSLALAMVVGAPVLALIALAPVAGRAAFDMLRFHVSAIKRFSEQLPTPDVSDYLSATTPGYHLALATLDNGFDLGLGGLRVAGAIFAIALGVLLGFALGRRTRDPLRAVLLGVPLAGSAYVILSGAFVLPDAAGWLGVLGVLLIALRIASEDRVAWGWYVAAGVVLTLLALVRQIHLWSSAALWTAAWWSAGGDRLLDALTIDVRTRLRRALAMVACTLPAFAAVGVFVWHWGGLTPPMFQGQYPPGVNVAGPAFVLALAGALGVFFAGWWAPIAIGAIGDRRDRPGALVSATAAVGLAGLVAIAVATDYDKDAGRWSGLWNLVRALPAPLERSPVIIALALLGGVTIWAAVLRASAPARWTLLAAGAGFVVAFSTGHELWQRYAEAFVLMWLALALAWSDPPPQRDRAGAGLVSAFLGLWRVAGPTLFVAASIAFAAHQVWRGQPVGEVDPDAPLPWALPGDDS